MPEELTFEQAGGHRRTIQRDEGVRPARTEVVNRARNEFLARAGLAAEEHGRLGGRHGLDRGEDAAQRRTVPHDRREAAVAAELVGRIRGLVGRRVRAWRQLAAAGNRLLDGVEQVVVAARFGEEFDGPGFHGAHRHRDVAVTGEENNRHVTLDLGQFLLQIEPAETWELDIEHQAAGDIRTRAAQERVRRGKGLDREPHGAEQITQTFADGPVIVYDKDTWVVLLHGLTSWSSPTLLISANTVKLLVLRMLESCIDRIE